MTEEKKRASERRRIREGVAGGDLRLHRVRLAARHSVGPEHKRRMGARNRTPSVRLPARRGPRHPARTGRATRSLTQYHRRLLGGRGKVVRGGPGGNLRYRDLKRGRHGRVPALTRASCRPIALGGLLTTRALRTARSTRSVRSNSPEGAPRIGADSIVSPSYDTRTHPSSVFGVYFYPAGRYRVSVHENVLQEGARRLEEGLLDLAFTERIVCE